MMEEFNRQKKVIDMMITSHSVLRDRYLFLTAFFENALLVISAILNSFVFIDEAYILKMTSISTDAQKMIIGITSILVFAISVVLLQVKWKERASQHASASRSLFLLLQEHRAINGMEELEDKKKLVVDFNLKYAQTTENIVSIPDSKFNELKLRHKRKVELSKLIDKHPGSFLWILKLKLFISSFKEKV